MVRNSPADHAKYHDNQIMMGEDRKIWVSKKDKNETNKWVRLNSKNIIPHLPIVPKFEYESFLLCYKKVKIPNTLFYYHNEFTWALLEEALETQRTINGADPNSYHDNGHYHRYSSNEFFDYTFKAKPKAQTIFVITDSDIIRSVAYKGSLIVYGMSKLDDRKDLIKSLREAFKDYSIKIPSSFKSGDFIEFKIQLKKI